MSNMQYDEEGIELTKKAEGFSSHAYQDSGGVWTIGFGHTGPEVHKGLVWTLQQGLAALKKDIGNKP